MSKTLSRTGKRLRKAFTLIEIMVSMTVMVVIILFVLQLTSSVLSSWNSGIAAISSNTEARLALDLISRDLESSVIKNNPPGIVWLEADQDSGIGDTAANEAEAAWLKFLTQSAAERDTTNPGDVTAVSYRLSWQWQLQGTDPSTANFNYKSYGLHRTLVPADDTFNDFMDDNNSGNWSGLNTRDPNNLIASNVIGFTVTIHWYDGTNFGRTTIGPDKTGLTGYSDDTTNKNYIATTAWVASAPSTYSATALYGDNAGNNANQITAVEVTMTILSDEGARVLNRIVEGKLSVNDATNGGNWNDFIVRYSSSYSRRVNVSNPNFL